MYRTIYAIEWKHPFTHISATCTNVTSELNVLPEWFVNKTQPPPSHTQENNDE